jgi:V8-like Glu-specific endopeptidase
MPLSRPQLRQKMKELFPSVPELIRFLVDYLPDLGRRVNLGMDRIVIENTVLESVPEATLEATLLRVPTGEAAQPKATLRPTSGEASLAPAGRPEPGGDDGTLTGPRYERFVRALLRAYPSKNSLARMVEFKLGKQLDELAFGEDLEDLAFNLVKRANAGGFTGRLIDAAIAGQPENPQLLAFFADRPPVSVTAIPAHKQALEAIVGGGEFVDVPAWLGRMERLVGQVCRIEVPGGAAGNSVGTGFLVGPDLILTNYHVVAPLLAGEVSASGVRVTFDYFGVGQGYGVGLATTYHLADSPMSPVDDEADKSRPPTETELDFALLRIDTSLGTQVRGTTGRPRGYLRLDAGTSRIEDRKPLFILQHPQGQPLKLHVDVSRGYNENGTRLHYTTNTLPGSSGSPCFDAQLSLVALHHSRDPKNPPQYNEGIPIEKIAAALKHKGIALPR